ncbi:MAG: tetratricopeptide repeat protein [Rhodobacteraceae bacterium]|nr:tetratricopeptide repeat protein [Paracoccaceae bacterium]
MRLIDRKATLAVAAFAFFIALFCAGAQVAAQSDLADDDLDELYQQLLDPADGDWESVEKRILKAWSHSGSDAMDLLLERGRAAINEGKLDIAIEHLTALTDHAPDFAEGWNARATAFFLAGKYGPSIADIEVTLKLNPHHFGALMGLGMIYEALDRPKAALKAFLAAKAVHPFRPDLDETIDRLMEKTQGTSL